MSAEQPGVRDRELTWLDTALEEKVGARRPPDLRHRVLSASPQQIEQARHHVRLATRTGQPGRSWWLAAALLLGAGSVLGAFHLFGGDPGPQSAGERQQDKKKRDGSERDVELRPQDLKTFQAHVQGIDTVSIQVITTTQHSHTLAPDQRTAVRFDDPEEVKRLRTLLGTGLRPAKPAGWIWPNRIRLHTAKGYLQCAMYLLGEPRLGIQGIEGDFAMDGDLATHLRSMIARAEKKSRIREGIVFTRNDLLRRDDEAVPAHVEKLTCYSLFDDDLALLGRFTNLRLLDLRGCSKTLNGPGLAHLAKLTTLRHILLNDTCIDDAALAALGTLPELGELNLRYTSRLTGTGFAAFQKTGALRRLNLTMCGMLTDEGLTALAGIGSLVHLDLSGRHLGQATVKGLAALGQAGALRYLDLEDCPVDLDTAMGNLGNLRRLEVLDLSDTKISTDGLAAFQFIHGPDQPAVPHPLRQLDLSRCPGIDARALEVLANYGRLEQLELARCSGLRPGVFAPIARMHNLRRLVLNATPVSAADCKWIASLPQLESLDLGFAKVDDEGLAFLAESRTIVELSLANCDAVTDRGLGLLCRMPRLGRLDLSVCDGITRTGVEQVRDARPKCEILVPDGLR